MHDAELYGRTVRVHFARPPKINERNQRPIWADDEWLKQYGYGSGVGDESNINGSLDKNGEGSSNDIIDSGTKKTLPRVYLGIKIGIRFAYHHNNLFLFLKFY